MHVHIATLGESIQPVTKAVNGIGGIDKVYLLCGKRFSEQSKVVSDLLKTMCIETHVMFVNGFDFQEITDSIRKIYSTERGKDVIFSINITGGTNLMAAAACSCAFFIGATIYYVQWDESKSIKDQITVIPTPHTPNMEKIKGQTAKILKYILENSEKHVLTNKEISSKFDVEKQNSYYHLNKLKAEGLIQTKRGVLIGNNVDNRLYQIILTNQGKLIAKWLLEDSGAVSEMIE